MAFGLSGNREINMMMMMMMKMMMIRVWYLRQKPVGEGSKAGGVSPTLPFPVSLPSPFQFPLSFQTNQWEGRSDPVRGKFPGFPPTNTTLLMMIHKQQRHRISGIDKMI